MSDNILVNICIKLTGTCTCHMHVLLQYDFNAEFAEFKSFISSAVFEENPRYCHSQLVHRALRNNFCNIEDSYLIFGMHVQGFLPSERPAEFRPFPLDIFFPSDRNFSPKK